MRLIDADALRAEWLRAVGEYTANEILGSIDDMPTIPQEMSAREYVRERDRMCAHHNAFCDDCPVLPERMEGEKVLHNCPIWTMRDHEKAVAIVEKWAQEHPEGGESCGQID